MRPILFSLVFLFVATTTTFAQQLCGLGADECEVPLGKYNIELPDRTGLDGPVPAMIYFHGAGGSGQRSLRNRNMVEAFLARGYAVIAPSGLKRPGSRFGPLWSFHPNRKEQRDELAFTKSVLDDAVEKFNLDRNRVLMTGFSIGGSMTWYLACKDPNVVKAYAPVAGSFWRPHDAGTDCVGPIKLLHTHGWRDGTVPLEGRVLGGGSIVQGDVFYGLQILRKTNGCWNHKADEFDVSGIYLKRWWTKCKSGSALQFNLHRGGHIVPVGWAEEAINWFEGLDEEKPG